MRSFSRFSALGRRVSPLISGVSATRSLQTLQVSSFSSPSQSDLIPTSKLKKRSIDAEPAVLIACGSFSPLTLLHLRLFEDARNYLSLERRSLDVLGGYLSPVHDAYGKKSLVPVQHRLDMCRKGTADSDWIEVSSWEASQSGWSTTRLVLEAHHEVLNQNRKKEERIRTLLLCGADLLHSFLTPNLWSDEDIEKILREHGLACLQREGTDLATVISASPILSQYKSNIHLIPQPIVNNVSSTIVRDFLKRGLSIKYLVPDGVAEIIYRCKLYGALTRSQAMGLTRAQASTSTSQQPVSEDEAKKL